MKNQIIITLLFLLSFSGIYAQDTSVSDTLLSNKDSVKVIDEGLQFEQKLTSTMDAMLEQWYIKREMANIRSVVGELKDDTTAVLTNDSLIIDRLSKIKTVIPLAYNNKVKRWIELYTEKRKLSSSVMLGLAQYYFPWMREIFDKYDVPEELIYLTIVESNLNPVAVSRAGATGIFQFMYTTGKVYGLEVNTFIDDRRDPYKATDAAARHLKDLYNMFHDWGLAIAAYNCGPGNVRKAINRAGANTKHDFWSLSAYLPKETQNYFPAYISVLYLMNYYPEHGIVAAPAAISLSVDTIMINKELHLDQVANVLGIDLKEIEILNPQYKRGVIPAYTEPYPLRLKHSDIIHYMDHADSIHSYQYSDYFTPLKVYENMFTGTNDPNVKSKTIYHTVKSGESLSKIAARYHLSVTELKKMNKLSSNSLKVKQRLIVGYEPVIVQKSSTSAPAKEAEVAKTNDEKDIKTKEEPKNVQKISTPEYYVVKKGDTLYGICGKLKVDPKKLAQKNGLKNMNTLSIGQKLLIPR